MGTYFLDSSAIVKRYVTEQGQAFILSICDPNNRHDLYISQIALIEVVASMCRRTRENDVTVADRDRFIELFIRDSRKAYGLQLITNTLLISAGNLCRLHRLRAYDAVQLAGALRLRDKALSNQAPPPIFVSSDNNLINISLAEGLAVENPNNYP